MRKKDINLHYINQSGTVGCLWYRSVGLLILSLLVQTVTLAFNQTFATALLTVCLSEIAAAWISSAVVQLFTVKNELVYGMKGREEIRLVQIITFHNITAINKGNKCRARTKLQARFKIHFIHQCENVCGII